MSYILAVLRSGTNEYNSPQRDTDDHREKHANRNMIITLANECIRETNGYSKRKQVNDYLANEKKYRNRNKYKNETKYG